MEPQNTRNRRSIRLKGYDYTREGAYFVTICAQDRKCLFGEIVDGRMVLNEVGKIVCDEWLKTPILRPYVICDAFVIMPNHFHGIVTIADGRDTARRVPTVERFGQPVSGSIPTIIRSFKSAATKRINELQKTPGLKLWQRNYYEHIIRDPNDFNRICEYIEYNPLRWELDALHPTYGKKNG
jgi:putative transposase